MTTVGRAFTVTARSGLARAGVLRTPHGDLETPVFMPVGTQGTVKALASEDVEALGARILLGNTYHLMLRPGPDLIAAQGGLHRFMAWPHAILTDSGGFQVFSLRERRRVDDDGATFRSHLDGSLHRLSPERAMQVQAALGSDIAMAFDECPPSDAPEAEVRSAMERTTRWAARCLAVPAPEVAPGARQLRFGIFQGGVDVALRREHLAAIAALPFDGLAIGGLGVGEPPAVMHRVVAEVVPAMPADRARYLMGVGTPLDLVTCIGAGVDMFDCVMPTRSARNGRLFVPPAPEAPRGHVNIANASFRQDGRPLVEGCPCALCSRYSRAYLSHLWHAEELLYFRLSTLHNLTYYLNLIREARRAIVEDRYAAFEAAFRASFPPTTTAEASGTP